MAFRNRTAAHFAEIFLNETAAASGICWDTYQEFVAQMRVAYPIVCDLLRIDPSMSVPAMFSAFSTRYAS